MRKRILLFVTHGLSRNYKSRSTWRHPNGKDENHIDYILVDIGYRNSITNVMARKDADCGSDHDQACKISLWKNSARR